MNAVKFAYSLLIVDDGALDAALIRTSVLQQFNEKTLQLNVVVAKDGANAFTKFANQKFDAVIVNAAVPRMKESGLQERLEGVRGGFSGPLYVVGEASGTSPFALKGAKSFPLPLDPKQLIDALIADIGKEVKAPAANPYAVDVRVINAIIASTLKVLGQFNMANIVMAKAAPRGLHEPMGGVISSVLEIESANFRGQLSVSFDEASFLEMASGMLCEEQTSINAENQDAVGELNNIIFGNAKAEITSYGVQLTIPKVVLGAGQMMACPEGSASLRVPFQTAKGKFFIDLIAYP